MAPAEGWEAVRFKNKKHHSNKTINHRRAFGSSSIILILLLNPSFEDFSFLLSEIQQLRALPPKYAVCFKQVYSFGWDKACLRLRSSPHDTRKSVEQLHSIFEQHSLGNEQQEHCRKTFGSYFL